MWGGGDGAQHTPTSKHRQPQKLELGNEISSERFPCPNIPNPQRCFLTLLFTFKLGDRLKTSSIPF